jgi:hypothetical protein
MKSKVTFYAMLLALIIALGTAIALSQSEDFTSQDIKRLNLQVKPDKESYLPGEVITLNFKVLNNSVEPVLLPKSVDVQTGQLQIFIADENGQYNQYIGPRWGLADVISKKAVKLAPGESFETSATVLHNQTIEIAHLSEIAAAEIAKGRIKTEYALPKPGMYFIKAILSDDKLTNKIESEPISVIIEEPQGVDLEVWNKIKDDGNFALFMQTGELKERQEGPKTKQIVASLSEIERSFPTTRYISKIRSGLAKQRALLRR